MKKQDDTIIYTPGSLDIVDWDIDFHNLMLGDSLRMEAYKKAIFEAIKPGMIVCEIGVGTGILSKWALEAGATKVYGVEVNDRILEIAKKNLSDFGDRFIPISGCSFDASLPERVDCILSEILGNIMDNENCAAILKDAELRFLKPGGFMLPAEVCSFFVPVDFQDGHSLVSEKKITPTHHDSLLIQKINKMKTEDVFNFYYDTLIDSSSYLAVPKVVSCMKKGQYSDSYSHTLSFEILRSGHLSGFKGFFEAQLSKETCLTTESSEKYSTSWKHAYFPIKESFPVLRGDVLELSFERKRGLYSWGGRSREKELMCLSFLSGWKNKQKVY